MRDCARACELPERLEAYKGTLLVDRPTGEFIAEVIELPSADVHSKRIKAFGLGSLVYQCAHEEKAACGEEGQEAAFGALMELTRGPLEGADEEAKVLALGALGNSGSPKMLPMMEEMAAEPSGLIRNSVAHALRRVRRPP